MLLAQAAPAVTLSAHDAWALHWIWGALLAIAAGGVPAFLLVAALGRPVIAALSSRSARQIAYEDAPDTHQKKTGTPTMGGVLFLVAPIVLMTLVHSRESVALAVLLLGCMAIGYLDDTMSIRGGKNRGLRARPKFALTALAALIFLVIAQPAAPQLIGIGLIPTWLWYALSLCVILATTHSVNLTDGLDGLASGTSVPPLLVLIWVAAALPYDPAVVGFGHPGAAIFGAALLGAVLGFLLYNRHPARVFMGDTGSLALGGAIAGCAIVTGSQLLLLLIGAVFVAETLSVMIQVASFKTTGKRVFRMSPLHHHFELGGWTETKVTQRFWLASLVCSLIGFAIVWRVST
jgi:phospho-N-acetylmuramoyl-pentapeptide-transferase